MSLKKGSPIAVLCLVVACSGVDTQNEVDQVLGSAVQPLTTSSSICPEYLGTDTGRLYIESLFYFIAAANPETFQDAFAPDKFCFIVEDNPKATASSRAEEMLVRVTTGLLHTANSDAEVAMVLSHELAHVTEQHLEWGGAPSVVSENEEWLHEKALAEKAHRSLDIFHYAKNFARMAELETLLSQTPYDTALQNEYEALLRWQAAETEKTNTWQAHLEEMDHIFDKIWGEPGASHNWSEEVADEIGFAFALRAGFDPDAFSRIMVSTYKVPGIEKCLADIEDSLAGKSVSPPERGHDAHPAPCWRIYNIDVTQRQILHRDLFLDWEEQAIRRYGKLLVEATPFISAPRPNKPI